MYVAVPGPNLETRAEYRFLRTIGADVVGMSTVPEVIVAVHAGMRVLGLSIVTDMCLPDALKPANIDHIIATANDCAAAFDQAGAWVRWPASMRRGECGCARLRTKGRRWGDSSGCGSVMDHDFSTACGIGAR